MKIAMIGHKRIPSREGGVEIVVEELSTRMAALGHEVTVYNRRGLHVSGAEPGIYAKEKRFEYRNVRVVSVPTPENKSLNAVVYAFLATLRAIGKHYDVIHYHAEGPCLMIPLAALFGIRTVATIHGLDWQRSKWGGIATKVLLRGEKSAAKQADELIVLSGNVQKYFRETYGRETSYIPNGIAIPEKREATGIRRRFGLEKNRYILFLARIVPEKGLHYLIKAYRQLETDVKLVIAGGSSHSDAYVREIRKESEADQRILMTGFVQGRALEELYSNCALYVLPSDVEGMPISLLEAMSYGCSCLISDIPESRQITGEHGICFRKGDFRDLKSKLHQFLQDREGKLQSRQGRQEIEELRQARIEYVRENYNWDRVVRQTLALYEGKSGQEQK